MPIITIERKWKRQLFSHINILLSSKVSVVLKILSLHVNINLSNRRFPHEQFSIFKYSSTLYAFLHSQSHVLGFHILSFIQEPLPFNSLQSYQHSSWFYFSNEYIHFHSMHIYIHMIHAELNVLFHLLLLLNQILLESYFFTLFGTQTPA